MSCNPPRMVIAVLSRWQSVIYAVLRRRQGDGLRPVRLLLYKRLYTPRTVASVQHPARRRDPITPNRGDVSRFLSPGRRSRRTHNLLAGCWLLLAACTSDSTGPGSVAFVDVAPQAASLAVGLTLKLAATPKNAAGAVLQGRAIT